MAVKNTKASARLEGREVPEGHVRSQAVEQYIAEHTSKTAGGCTSRLGPATDTEAAEAFHPQTDNGAGELLNVLASEIWPLLEDSSPITKADQAQILGDPRKTDQVVERNRCRRLRASRRQHSVRPRRW